MQPIANFLLENFFKSDDDLYSYFFFDTKVACVKKYKNQEFFCYLLIDKTFITKENKQAYACEILFFPIETNAIDFNLIEPYSLIRANHFYRIGKISNKIFMVNKESSIAYIENKTPLKDVTLSAKKEC